MTAQEVIKNSMTALNIQNYDSSLDALDDAVKAGSRYSGIQEVIDNFLADQKTAERAAIKSILGDNYKTDYDGLQLSDLLELAETDTELAEVLAETAQYSDTPRNYHNEYFTAAERIRILTADTFLKDYCGIELERYIFPYENPSTHKKYSTYVNTRSTGNTDTGAITGSDAGGDTVKDSDTVVPEIGNKYTATGSARQIINTGTNDWIVSATSGNDTINSGGADSIDAGAGADVINVTGNNATISTGESDSAADTVNISSAVKNFTIENFEEFDKLNIEGNFILASATLANDTVTVTDATGKRTFKISGWTDAQNSYVTVNGKTLKLGKWLSAFVDFTETENAEAATVTDTSTAVTVNLSDVTDTSGSFSLSGNTATFSSVSGGAVGTVSSEAPEITTFTTQGLTVELWGAASDSNPKVSGITTLTYDTMSTAQKTVWDGVYKWWIKEGLKLNEESYGLGFTTDGVTGTNIKVFFYTDEEGSLAFVRNYQSGVDLELGINMAHFSTISESNENGSTVITQNGLSSTYNLDRTLAHELNHAILAANINNFNSLPQFFKEGIAELVHGIDDERATRIWDLAGGATDTSRLASSIDLTDTGTGKSDSYAAGYMLLRYFAKTAATQTSSLPAFGEAKVRVDLTGADATYYSNLNSTSLTRATTTATSSNYSVGTVENYTYELSPGIRQQIYASNDDWTFSGITSNNSVISGSGADSATITGEFNAVSLGGGNDSVSISGNNNTITGGDGADVYTIYSNVYSLTINDFDVANDSIYLPTRVTLAGYEDNAVILGDTTIYLNNAESISDFYDMSIRNGRTTTTLGDMLGVESFDWSAGTYYFLVFDDELNIYDGATVFSDIPTETYAKVVIDRNKNITISNVDDCLISITPPDSNAHTLTIGETSCRFTGTAGFIGSYAYSGNFTVSGSFNFYDINEQTFKNVNYSGNGNVTVTVGSNLAVSGLTNGAAVSITDGTNTENYTASSNYIAKETVTTISNGEEITTTQGAYTSGDILSATFDTEINHYVNDFTNFTVILYSGTLALEGYTFEIISASDGVTFNYDSSGENLVGISNFEEGESISIDNVTYTVSGGKIIRESDNKVYSGDFDEFISNFGSADYWQAVLTVSDTVISDEKYLTGTEDAENFTLKNVTVASGGVLNIDADEGNDTISVNTVSINGGYVTFGGSSDNDSLSVSKVTISGYGNLGIAGDSGNDTILVDGVTISNSEVDAYSGAGNDTISIKNVSVGSGGDFYIVGNSNEDSITVSAVTIGGGNVYVRGDGDNDTITASNVKVTNGNLEISGGYGSEKISVSNIIGNGKTSIYGDYSTGSTDDGNDNISVTDSSGVKIISGNGTDTLVFGGSVTATIGDFSAADIISLSSAVSEADFENGVLTLGNVTLNLENVDDISDYEGAVIVNGGTRTTLGDLLSADSWKVSNGVATYGNSITITGLSTSATADDISLSGKTVTISANALSTRNTVTITGDYKLALASDVETPTTGEASWNVTRGTATYTSGTSAGYVISNNQIIYQAETTGETLTTITGLSTSATADDISLSGKTVTISANALSTKNTVTITGDYKLALASDVETSTTTDAGWTVSNGTATYSTGSQTAGYVLSDNQISYTSATAAQTLVTVSGLKTSAKATQLSLDTETKTVTVAQAATTKGELTISDGYALNLAKGTYSKVTVVGGSGVDTILNNGTGVVISTGAGNDIISLASGTSKNTIIGGAGNDSISSMKGKNIFQYASGDGNDTITGFSATDTLQITSGEIAGWTVDDSDLTLKVGSGSIKIASGAGASINVLESDAKKAETFIYGENVKYNAKKTAVSLASNYSGSYSETLKTILTIDGAAKTSVQITGNDKANVIIGGAGADTLNGGKGNDTLTGGDGNDVFVYSAGKDVIADYVEGDKISIGADYTASIKSKDVIFKVGSNTLTVKNGVGEKINVDDSVYIYESGKVYNENKNAVTLTSAFKGTIDSGILTVTGADASSNIVGNSGNNSITGGKSADSLNGGTGNDTLTGGAGKDVFIYGGGNDTITDYVAGEDKISIGADITGVAVSGDNVIFGTSNGSITVIDAAGEKITTVDSKKKSSTQIYYDGYTYNEKQTAVTISSNYSGGLTLGSSLITIDGSEFTKSINITGNDKANVISGGTGNDTLNGGKGNDTLTGNGGKDIFVSGAGKDVITDYAEGDKISIGADYTASVKSKDVIFKISKDTLTVKNGAGVKMTVDDTVYIYESGKVYNGNKTAVTLNSAFKGTIDSGIVTVDGSTSSAALNITGNDSNNVIIGGTKGDSLNGGAGNDSLTGGAGKDTFFASSGNDTITDYKAGEDKIKFTAEISAISVSGDNLIFGTSSGSITVADGIGQKITTIDSKKKSATQIYYDGYTYNEKQTAVTLSANFSGSYTETLKNVVTIDGSAASKSLTITGNDKANVITGGSAADSLNGGKGADTLFGGAGNDTFTGGDGNDVFVYESGNDTITDYTSKDKIKISGDFAWNISGSDIIFTTDNGNLTVKDGAGKSITTLDSKNKSTTQKYSAASSQVLDLFEDNNFISDDTSLDSITEIKFAVTEIQDTKVDELSQTVLTYSDEK